MKRIKIRGIYSTSLTKLFLDNGWEVVDPSDKQVERFGLEKKRFPVDASIVDVFGGIKVFGPRAKEAVEVILENVGGIWREDLVGKVYKGKVIGSLDNEGNHHVVSMGNFLGILNEPLLKKYPIVQVKKEENGWLQLTQDIRIFGSYVVLIKDGKNSFHKEFPEEEREKFEDIREDDFGIFFTQFSIGRERDEIMEDIRRCKETYKRIMDEEFESYSFERSFIIKFGRDEREKLDKIRGSVVNTAEKHHLIRMLGLDGKLDVIEELDPKRIDILERDLEKEKITVIHDRLIGEPFTKELMVLEKREGYVKAFKEIKSLGFYDGLKKRKLPGDYMIVEVKEGEIFYKIEYFRKDGTKIGEYYNFNTPIEMFGNKVYYIDLIVDLIHTDKKWILVDVEDFKKLSEEFPSLKDWEEKILEKVKEITGGEDYEVEGS